MTELTCIVCPKGCRLNVDEENGFLVTGYGCPRGKEYGHKELTAPTRTLTSIVRIEGAIHPGQDLGGDSKEIDYPSHESVKKSPPQRSGGRRSGGGSGYLRNGCGLDYHKEYVDSQGAQQPRGPGTRRFRGLCYADCSSPAGGGVHEGRRSRLHVKPEQHDIAVQPRGIHSAGAPN